jgi:hypothetical protein
MALMRTRSGDEGGGGGAVADRRLARAWGALLLGTAAAGLHLPVSYALVKWTCAAGHRTPLVLLALAALAATMVAAGIAWSCCRWSQGRGSDAADTGADRALFLGRVGLGTNLILALFILLSGVGLLVVSPCA